MCDRPIKNASIKIKIKVNMNKWIKRNSWLVCMLIGIALLTWSIAIGEVFYWQIPVGCCFIVLGVTFESGNRI